MWPSTVSRVTTRLCPGDATVGPDPHWRMPEQLALATEADDGCERQREYDQRAIIPHAMATDIFDFTDVQFF